jgi:hypothetical protein
MEKKTRAEVIDWTGKGRSETSMSKIVQGDLSETRVLVMFGRVNCKDSAGGPGVDVWTSRVRDFELDLPAYAARIVLWDDLFSPDAPAAEIEDARQRLADTFGIDRPGETALALCPDRGSLRSAVECVVGTPADRGRRIAVIDVGSTGPTDLSWKDILPAARPHYDLVIGMAYVPLAGPRTWSAWLADNDMGDGLVRMQHGQLALCDVAVLTSDGLLGLGEGVDPGVRRTRVGEAMSRFIDSLAGARMESVVATKRGERPQAPRYFALGRVNAAAEESIKAQRRLIDEEFGAPYSEHPILDGPCGACPPLSMTLWPFDPNGHLRCAHISG